MDEDNDGLLQSVWALNFFHNMGSSHPDTIRCDLKIIWYDLLWKVSGSSWHDVARNVKIMYSCSMTRVGMTRIQNIMARNDMDLLDSLMTRDDSELGRATRNDTEYNETETYIE